MVVGLGDGMGDATVASSGGLLLSADIGKKKEKKKKKVEEDGPQVPAHMVPPTSCGDWRNSQGHSEDMKTLR